jgi:hypothetical protein
MANAWLGVVRVRTGDQFPTAGGTMSEHDRDLASMDDGDVDRHRVVQSVIQEVIDGLGRDAAGRDPSDLQADLTRALAAKGIGEQPPRWLEAVCVSLSNGHRYVEDAREA